MVCKINFDSTVNGFYEQNKNDTTLTKTNPFE